MYPPPRPPLRPVLGYEAGSGLLVAVTLTGRARGTRRGAGLTVLAPRADLDERLRPGLGWHWFEAEGGDLKCALSPTADDVLAKVALDIDQGGVADYQLAGDEPLAEQLREAARLRMAIPASEAVAWAERLLRWFVLNRDADGDF